MIQITCTSCKKVLSIDDAFAGGVCRCQFCGTIQTVPAKGAAQKATAGAGKGSKTLFENKARSPGMGSGSGLDDLADIVQSSSGLSDARLRKKTAPPPAPAKSLMPLLGGAIALIVILVLVVVFMAMRGSGLKSSTVQNNPAPTTPDNTEQLSPSSPAPATPNFCGVPIDPKKIVIYVIDNGSSSAEVLDSVKAALFKSIESLGPDARFQILFWNPDTDSFPSGKQTAFAVKENIDTARKKLQDVTASGSTDPISALQAAIAADPGQIILVTAKAGDLDDSLVDQVASLRGASTAQIDCFAINGVPNDKVLAKIASNSGGKFVPLGEAELKSFSY
jgi:von Willebrand factor type A domain